MLFVSVIVITKNNHATIEECIAGLLNQSYSGKNYEIIFVDGHSRDGTDEIIKKRAEGTSFLKLCYENYGSMGYARNIGIDESKGDIIAFTDGDAIVPNDWIERIAQSFTDDSVTAVGGLDILVSDHERDRLVDSWRRLEKVNGLKAIPCIKTVNFAVRRSVVVSGGYFDPKLSHWDEAELMARLYFKTKATGIVYDPTIVVYHKRNRPASFAARIKKTFRKSLTGTPTLLRRHMAKVALANPTSTIGISFLLIPLCITSIPVTLFLIAFGWFAEALLIGLLFYVVGLCAYSVGVFQRTGRFTPSILASLTIDFIVRSAGTFCGLFKWLRAFTRERHSKQGLSS